MSVWDETAFAWVRILRIYGKAQEREKFPDPLCDAAVLGRFDDSVTSVRWFDCAGKDREEVIAEARRQFLMLESENVRVFFASATFEQFEKFCREATEFEKQFLRWKS